MKEEYYIFLIFELNVLVFSVLLVFKCIDVNFLKMTTQQTYVFRPSSLRLSPFFSALFASPSFHTRCPFVFFLIYHLSSIFVFSLQPCFYLLTPPCSPIFCLLLPCPSLSLSLSNERGIFERKRVREKERQQKEEVEVEGWVPIRAAASSLHVARNTTLRQKKGIIRWQTAFTQGTSYWQPQNR